MKCKFWIPFPGDQILLMNVQRLPTATYVNVPSLGLYISVSWPQSMYNGTLAIKIF